MKIIQKISMGLFVSLLSLGAGISHVSGEELLENEGQETVKKLSLQSVHVVDMDILKLSFGVNLDDSKEKDFIVKSLPIGNEIEVNEILVDGNNVLLSIGENFESNKQYEVIIISLYGEDGSTIVSGIDGAVEFSAPDMEQFTIENVVQEVNQDDVELNSADDKEEPIIEEPVIEEKDVAELKEDTSKTVAEKIDEANEKNNGVNLGGKAVSQEELDKNVAVAAGKTDALPTTGPEHIFFIILAVILAGLVLHTRNKKV